MKLPLNRSYLNGRVRPWTMKHRLSDLMRVVRRSVELATESGRSWTELWWALDPSPDFSPIELNKAVFHGITIVRSIC